MCELVNSCVVLRRGRMPPDPEPPFWKVLGRPRERTTGGFCCMWYALLPCQGPSWTSTVYLVYASQNGGVNTLFTRIMQ